MNLWLYRVRRTLLRVLVPEFVWPRTVTMDGARIRVRGAPYSFGVKHVLRHGDYEVDERQLLAGILQPGDVVVEMGGSIGVLTAIIAHKVGPTGFVVSVEASTTLTRYSKTWLEALGNVKVRVGFAFPVWELRAPIAIERFEENWGSMSGRVTFAIGGGAPPPAEPAQPLLDVRTLSAETPRPPVTLVVDIEGSERVIAEQAPGFPATLRHVLIELHPGFYGEETKLAIIRNIEAEGFRRVAEEGTVLLFVRAAE